MYYTVLHPPPFGKSTLSETLLPHFTDRIKAESLKRSGHYMRINCLHFNDPIIFLHPTLMPIGTSFPCTRGLHVCKCCYDVNCNRKLAEFCLIYSVLYICTCNFVCQYMLQHGQVCHLELKTFPKDPCIFTKDASFLFYWYIFIEPSSLMVCNFQQ